MKNKVILKFLLLFLMFLVVDVKAATYTSLSTSTCDSINICDYKVSSQLSEEMVVFCLNGTVPYPNSSRSYSDENEFNTNKNLIISNYNGKKRVYDYERGLMSAYYNLPEMRNDSFYDSNGNLIFENLAKDLILKI